MTIVIIDAHEQSRAKIVSTLTAQKDMTIAAEGKDAYDALKYTGSLQPDIAIIDIHLEFIEVHKMPPLVRVRSPKTALVLLTTQVSDVQLQGIVNSEVNGLVHKVTELDFLPQILKWVSEGGYFISPFLMSRVLHLRHASKQKGQAFGDHDPVEHFSKSELQILTCLGEGHSSSEISKRLSLTEGTVRNYISALMQKMRFHNRLELSRYALTHGLVAPTT